MQDWNVIVTVRQDGFKRAFRFFNEFGPLSKTGFFNVLVLKTSDADRMLDVLRERIFEDPGILNWLARVIPMIYRVSFQTGEELESKAREILLLWTPELAGKGFHVRMHRRGMKGKISSWETEKRFNEFLLEELDKSGTPGHIAFDDPDAVIAVETLGSVAGLSLWEREDLERYPFLRFDSAAHRSPGGPEKPVARIEGEA
jgi:tRNA(Ser,Leu) C12 N-acetylase TAN1